MILLLYFSLQNRAPDYPVVSITIIIINPGQLKTVGRGGGGRGCGGRGTHIL